VTSISGSNHFWQNWSKTHAYVAERIFFPRYPDDIADAIKQAEAAQRPIRAVGGGYSFSDASLPGAVTTNRPDVNGLEALAEILPRTVTFPTSTTQPSIASVTTGMPGADGMGSMIMIADPGGGIDPGFALWSYSGAGTWTKGTWTYGPTNPPGFLDYLARAGDRPVSNPMGAPLEDTDVAGSLVMFDLAKSPARPSRDWFYNGQGIWSVGINGDSPFDQGDLGQLKAAGRIGPNSLLSPRAAGSGEAMSLVLSRNSSDTPKLPEPVFLIDMRMLTSSLQQSLPDILSQPALDATSTNRPVYGGRRFFFHVEAGIPTAQLAELLSHQSPRLSLRATSGSSGATLAGAISSATHGAEFKWPLLVDTVQAVHMVGPGGHHWWIEGDESIVDPQKLRRVHPEFAPERIILGTSAIAGVKPQDWLNAAIVSMGCMGVIYSVVLEVFPLFGVHEAVVQTTWRGIGNALANVPVPGPFTQGLPFDTKLRLAATSSAASRGLLDFILDGSRNGTGISLSNNVYCDLAINPNRRLDGDFDCWIGNREGTIRVPIDPQPAWGNDIGAMVNGVTRAFSSPSLVQKFRNVYQAGNLWDIVWNLSGTQTKLTRLGRASALIDVGLDTFLTPMITNPDGPEVAQVFVSGILAGMLGTANSGARSDKTGVNVGATGFPTSGIMGTALEIALAPADAFGFLVTEILDKIDAARPFFGYVSIRITRPTKTLMGMQQFGDSTNPQSVMIEIVAFASPNSQQFMRDLQIRTLDRISKGLDAMLHWGLENDRLNGGHLRATMALRRPASPGISKLDTFKTVRGVLRAASLAQPSVFDNAFTSRLWLNSQVADDDPYSFQSVLQGTRKSTVIAPWNRGHAPMRIIGVYADGAFRLRGSFDTPSRPPNLEIGAIPVALTPVGDFFELPVTFIAVEPGQHNGTLTIVTYADVPDSIRVIRVHLHANVDALVVSVVDPVPPLGRDFGTVTAGDTKTMQILVHSDSTMSAQLESYALSDALATSQIGVATLGVGPLSPGQTKAYWVSCTPTVVGAFATYVTLTFVAGVFTRYTQELTVPLFWNAVGAQAELAPSTLDFGTVVVGARSAAAPVTLRNRGQLPLTVSYALIGAGFQVTGQAPPSIAAGQDEEIFIEFRPGVDGPVSYPFTIASNSAQPPAPVLLTGIGLLQPFFTASPASVSFGSVPIDSQSPQKVVEIVNAGHIVVQLQGFTLSGPDAPDFKITNVDRAVGDVFRLEQRLRVTLVFAARTAGIKAATLEIAHDGTTSPFRVSIDGIATAVQGLVPSVTELDLGDVRINTRSQSRALTFTNAAAVEANVSAVDVTGRDRADFIVVSENCTAKPLAPGGGTCTVILVARPSAMGPEEADLTVTANVPADNVPLHAVGLDIRVEWAAARLEFDNWKVGQTSQRQEVTLHNSGNAAIETTGIDVEGDFLVQDIVPQYTSIPPNGYKYFWVWFRPAAAGPQQGAVTVQINGPGALPPLELTGIGVP
jgi:hypothetical protein